MNRLKGILFPQKILLVAAILGWSFDYLFYGKAIGISLLLFVLMAAAALFFLGSTKTIRPQRRNLWLLLPLLFFAAMAAVRSNPFLILLNVVAALFLLEFVVHFFTSGRLEQLGIFEYPLILTWVAAHSSVQAAPLVPSAVDAPRVGQQVKRNLMPVARGLLLALPILLIFTIFLASADQVFAAYINSAFTTNVFDKLFEYAGRGTLIIIVTWVAAGALAYGLVSQSAGRGSATIRQMTGFLRRGPSLGFTESAVILSLVNGLFMLFVWIQFAYLFGGRININVDGRPGPFTYAEYARRGFFELVFVAILTLALVLSLHWLTTRAGRGQMFLFNGLSTLMSGLVMVMLVSAFQRLGLYEKVYGYTWLRLWVHTFMIWLGFVFVWFLFTLWRTVRQPSPEGLSLRVGVPSYFAFGVFLAAIGFLTTLNLINPDQFIARQNLTRYAETGDLDGYYLTSLTDDGLPVLVPALPTMPEAERPFLCADLYLRQEKLNEATSWVSFNIGRYQARQTLNNNDWQQYCPPVEELPIRNQFR
ncbi:MAG: DUF4173 domain-containing protein [Candidatus Promineifilaceae bacterium]